MTKKILFLLILAAVSVAVLGPALVSGHDDEVRHASEVNDPVASPVPIPDPTPIFGTPVPTPVPTEVGTVDADDDLSSVTTLPNTGTGPGEARLESSEHIYSTQSSYFQITYYSTYYQICHITRYTHWGHPFFGATWHVVVGGYIQNNGCWTEPY